VLDPSVAMDLKWPGERGSPNKGGGLMERDINSTLNAATTSLRKRQKGRKPLDVSKTAYITGVVEGGYRERETGKKLNNRRSNFWGGGKTGTKPKGKQSGDAEMTGYRLMSWSLARKNCQRPTA